MKQSKYVVGLMSGTSLDGIDAVVVEIKDIEGNIDMELLCFLTLPYSSAIKEQILMLCDPHQARIEDISSMNMLLGELFANASLQVIKEAGLLQKDILLISSHGQTIFHQPDSKLLDGREITSTLQIGDIGVIAERTGITTIGDFRTRDMAAGGKGAPLVPYADYMLFREKNYGRVLVNIGGISNITTLPKNCAKTDIYAFDTGPGNMLIDAFVEWVTNGNQTYDRDGKLASKGEVNDAWLKELLEHPHYKLQPPKSTGREMFGKAYATKLWHEAANLKLRDTDKIATITALTAKSIVNEINRYIEPGEIKEVLISGGGGFNHTLMNMIKSYLPNDIDFKKTDEYGMPADAKEAMVFALLGYQCFNKRTNNLPAATGAEKSVIMGKIAW
ncbi:anhydro-N-acetylmuramic acid kinase [Oceanobacillus bengalensis]|uniref:Anhydro-N-acetylmuramic acid kinase n=1 Tax=Oceanobacillus bengalensis TaxID=1435466 RepID=A0A494Z141_9BACI|nr:anhydro-N-acetylmuramic acid kinase [Oceanobacillus bengalensis]RKQ15696.1 anhydro-N-acetylmuramic acid kinase [Oceanobacillus bengalensis]